MAKESERKARSTRQSQQRSSSVPQRLIDAAQCLIREGGVESVTVQALIAKADVYPDAVRYHFGGKAALLAAVVESLANDDSLSAIADSSAGHSSAEQIRRLVESDRALLEDLDSFRDFYAILPYVVTDSDLRKRVAAFYSRYREVYSSALTEQSRMRGGRLAALTAIILATVDGLAVQILLDPDSVVLDTTLNLFEEMLDRALEAG